MIYVNLNCWLYQTVRYNSYYSYILKVIVITCFFSFELASSLLPFVLGSKSFNSRNLESGSAENQLSLREMCLVKLNGPEHSSNPKFLSLVEW